MNKPRVFNDGDIVIDADAVVMVEDIGNGKVGIYCAGWEEPAKVLGEMQTVLSVLNIEVALKQLKQPEQTPEVSDATPSA